MATLSVDHAPTNLDKLAHMLADQVQTHHMLLSKVDAQQATVHVRQDDRPHGRATVAAPRGLHVNTGGEWTEEGLRLVGIGRLEL